MINRVLIKIRHFIKTIYNTDITPLFFARLNKKTTPEYRVVHLSSILTQNGCILTDFPE